MFKKTLLALALAGASTVASADTTLISYGTLDIGTDEVVNTQSVSTLGGSVIPGIAATFTTDSTVSVKTITIDVMGGVLKAGSVLSLVGSTTTPTPTSVNLTSAGTVDYVTTTQAVLTLTTATDLSIYDDGIAISGLVLSADSDSLGSQIKFKVTTAAQGALGTDVSVDAVVAQYVNEFSVAPLISGDPAVESVFSATVDVNTERKTFLSDELTDTATIVVKDMSVDINDQSGDFDAVATTTVTADFSFLDGDLDGAVDDDNTLSGDVADDLQSTEISSDLDDDASENVVVSITSGGEVVLPVQSFSYETKVEYADDKFLTFSGALGEWDINGSSVTFPYAPVNSTSVTTNFEISNTSNQTAGIVVDAIDQNGNVYENVTIVSANTGEPIVATNMKVTKVSDADIAASLDLEGAGKLNVKFVINAPKEKVKITGYSNVANNGGRMTLLSDAYEK